MGQNLNPWFVTGLTDADGNFSVSVVRGRTALGWTVNLSYSIVAANNSANRWMLEQIQSFFGGKGSININISDFSLNYTVYGLSNCLIIREHFLAYPLITYKLVYFLLWSAVLDLMVSKAHLTWKGLLQIIAYKAYFKMGLSDMLKAIFVDFIPVVVFPYLPDLALINTHWVAGFINGDGGFSVTVRRASDTLLGERVSLEINIVQHEISLKALQRAAEVLSCGQIKPKTGKAAYRWRVAGIKDINQVVAAFTDNGVRFLGAKALDYADFCKALSLINSKDHLTREGLTIIKSLSAGMNSTRTDFGSN